MSRATRDLESQVVSFMRALRERGQMEADALSRRLAEGPAEGLAAPLRGMTSTPRGGNPGRMADGSKSSA